jgi:Zn finger protein HypA/HybF involved in hydrogenase expression
LHGGILSAHSRRVKPEAVRNEVGSLTNPAADALQSRYCLCHPQSARAREGCMKETRKVHYVKGVFVCPKCRQSYVQEKWIEEWRVRCHKCDYRGTLTEVSVEERMEEEVFRR